MEFPHESALWPSDGDLLLIIEPGFAEKIRMDLLQLLPHRKCDIIAIYHPALTTTKAATVVNCKEFHEFSWMLLLCFIVCPNTGILWFDILKSMYI